jgi:hypothetical protein
MSQLQPEDRTYEAVPTTQNKGYQLRGLEVPTKATRHQMVVTMPEPSKALTQPSRTWPEIKLMVRWTPIIGSKYSYALASGTDAEGRKFLLSLPFAVIEVGMVKSNLPRDRVVDRRNLLPCASASAALGD